MGPEISELNALNALAQAGKPSTKSMIVQYPAEILTTVCDTVTDFATMRQVVGDLMRELATPTGRKCLGLSAPQVGHPWRVFVLDVKYLKVKAPHVYINPKLIWKSDETDVVSEGCMSLPKAVEVSIRRSVEVELITSTEAGESITVRLSGLAARAAQHELDHIDGILILNYASRQLRRQAERMVA
jgi:peptide deformylase